MYLRIAAANTLGKIGSRKATIPLINILTDNQSDMWLRAESASALGDIGDKRAVDSLTKAVNEPSAPIRNAAQDALKKIVNGTRSTKIY
jgi:HEAT repeat protein